MNRHVLHGPHGERSFVLTLLVGLTLTAAPAAPTAQTAKDTPEPVIRALVKAIYANDVAGYTSVTPAAQNAKAASAAANIAAAAKLSGLWQLNKQLSTLPGPPLDIAQRDDGRRGGPSREGLLQMRAMTGEAADMPSQITIVATQDTISVTNVEGLLRKFAANDRKEKVDLFLVTANVKTNWDADTVRQEITSGQFKIMRTYQVSHDGRHLVVTTQVSGAPLLDLPGVRTAPVPVRLAYEKVR